MSKITGHAAIEYARANGLTLSKHADPIEGARDSLSTEEAEDVAREDPQLIWIAIDRVEGGKPGTEDYDTGRVLEVAGQRVLVAWEGAADKIWHDVSELRAVRP